MKTYRFHPTPRGVIAAFVFAALILIAPTTTHADGPPTGMSMYVVQYGDSLNSIAARYGVSAQTIMQANGMMNPYAYAGRPLYVPMNYGGAYSGAYSGNNYTPTNYTVYVVQPGDTLFGIARRFGTSVFALMRANHLFNPNFVFAGMRLLVPRANPVPPYQTYIVRFGDTLTRIALRFGTSVYALMIANGIPNPNLIFAGMRLVLPNAAPYGTLPPSAYPTPSYGTPAPTVIVTPTLTPSNAVTVSMQNIMFAPQKLNIHVGTIVRWTNNDQVPHTVTSGSPGAPNGIFDSGTLNPGQSFAFTFNSIGTFPYYCRIHGAMMIGSITVVQ